MGVRSLVAAFVVLLLAPTANAADDAWTREAKAARTALSRSADAGYLTSLDRDRYLGILRHARAVRDRVPPLRAQLLDEMLARVAKPKSPTASRALTLYEALRENTDYLDRNRVPADGTDVTATDGIVYRFFAGKGFAFHPLANASRLNALTAAGKIDEARTLVDALAARTMPQPDGAVVWEYQFDFGKVHAPWTSGMAQAVMAQALARAGSLELARRAYRAIPGRLDRELPAGPWVRLYSGSGEVVLNAQLQSAISLGDYADLAQDPDAAGYADRLLEAARALLPRFDTGHWSRYSLGAESTLHYQTYVIDLLTTLAKRTGDTAWTDAAERFELYETQPPALTSPSVTSVVYPRPEDGVRDELVVRFRLSKPSKVALVVDGEAVDGSTWTGGWHTFRWTPRKLAPGTHAVRLVARSTDGHPGEATLPSFSVERDATPPELAATKAGGRVYWSAKDRESACCRLRLELRRGAEQRVVPLTRTRGAAAIPSGYWLVTAVARDTAGNVTRHNLGLVVGHKTRPE